MFTHNNQFLHKETSQTTCESLLSELQTIWDEVGEPTSERDKMLVQLEEECLEAYRRKIKQESHNRTRLRQAVTESKAELALIYSAMGERAARVKQFVQGTGSLKQELEAIMPELEEMRKRKSERRSQFIDVLDKIHNTTKEMNKTAEDYPNIMVIDESDLSLNRLDELQSQLRDLEKEKRDRLKLILDLLNSLNSLCVVLGLDFQHTVREVQITLDDSSSTKNINVDTIARLSATISKYKEVKRQRMQQLQDFAASMVDLWTLMDTPFEEQKKFHCVTQHLAATENEFTEPNILSLDFISSAEAEVSRLLQMKSSKMKEVILKKKLELEELCRKAHMVEEAHTAANYSFEAIESGTIDLSYLLEQIELQISKVKEEAFSRKDILEKVDKWLEACEEESWLDEYSRDDNRYNTGRGTHLMLRRAEKARIIVNKVPARVKALIAKARAWEEERRTEFLYDGVPLVSMLEQYNTLRKEKEQERQRQRDQKKLQGQLLAEQEVLFGSKPSPVKSGKKVSRTYTGEAIIKRFSHVGATYQTPTGKTTTSCWTIKKSNSEKQHSLRSQHPSGGYVAPSSGKRSSRNTDLAVAKHPAIASNPHETQTRKPLSPVCCSKLSNANAAADIQVQGFTNSVLLERSPPQKTILSTDENKTPDKMPISMPTTPSIVTVATTPATPIPHNRAQETEYSFEERRAGVIFF